MKITHDELCKSCGIRPIAGYTRRYGHSIYLDTLCKKCYISKSNDKIVGLPYTTEFNGYVSVKTGKS